MLRWWWEQTRYRQDTKCTRSHLRTRGNQYGRSHSFPPCRMVQSMQSRLPSAYTHLQTPLCPPPPFLFLSLFRMGDPVITFDPDKLIAVVESDYPDNGSPLRSPGPDDVRIAEHILEFLEREVNYGRLPKNLLPIQSGGVCVCCYSFARLFGPLVWSCVRFCYTQCDPVWIRHGSHACEPWYARSGALAHTDASQPMGGCKSVGASSLAE